ncbi:MAG: iron ABC transporter permease [Chloroflexi bacterium]|nr:iron ABC transporter permease [Chloroflexota bacterium]
MIPALAFLALFFVYPLAAILSESLAPGGAFSLAPFETVLGDDFYLGRLWFTTWQAFASTALTLALGLPSAYVFARYDFPGKSLIRALTTIPFVLPVVVVAIAFTALLGPSGALNEALQAIFGLDEPPIRVLNTITVILLAHAFYNYTIVVRTVSALWANVDPRSEEAARMLGAGPLAVFRRVTLPQIAPAILSSSLLVFRFCFTSFGVVLILGGPQFATLDATIYNLTARLFRLPLAAALAVVQIVFTLAVMWTYARLQARSAVPLNLQPQSSALRRVRGRRERLLIGGNFAVVFLWLGAPLLALVERSFRGAEGYGVGFYAGLESNTRGELFFVSLSEALTNSLWFAATTVAIAVPLGTALAFAVARARGRWRALADGLAMLPLGVSVITLAFGILIAFDTGVLDLRASWMIIVVAHTLIAYPFVMRSVLAVVRGIDERLREAAATLGASPRQTFRRIDLPIVSRATLVGATFAFAISIGDFGAALLLSRPEYATMNVAIFRYLGLAGAERLGAALAMSVVLMLVSGLGFLLIERLRYRDVGEF